MSAGVPDAMNLVEIRCRRRAQPIDERRKGVSLSAILCLELTKLRFGTTQYELGERRRVAAQPLAKRLERGGERRCLGDRVSMMRRGHADECSTVQHLASRQVGVGTHADETTAKHADEGANEHEDKLAHHGQRHHEQARAGSSSPNARTGRGEGPIPREVNRSTAGDPRRRRADGLRERGDA